MINVCYKKKFLEKCYQSKSAAIKRWGQDIGRKYIKQMSLVYAANTITDLYTIPTLRFHPLKRDRKGQYSITLGKRARIIVEIEGNTILIVEEVNTEHYE
ncbi:type II toxin-antitoxin system RelE/ParE family toxin [bacterium]|nr:type II toxin-antitoxin system RelE/ParE family toxin [bacterium]